MSLMRVPIESESTERWATWYVFDRNYRVFPVWRVLEDGNCACGDPACKVAGDHLIPGIDRFRPNEVCSSNDHVRGPEFFAHHPLANIGIATGDISGIWVLQVVAADGGTASLAALTEKHGPLPNTLRGVSAEGDEQYVFTYDKRVDRGTYGTVGLGLFVATNMNWVVVTPSVSSSGRRATWHFVDGDLPRPVKAPGWLIELAAGAADKVKEREAAAAQKVKEREAAEREKAERKLSARERYERGLSTQAADGPVVLSASDVFNMKRPPLKFILRPWLKEKDLGLLVGEAGVSKTWLMLGTACSIALGKPFLGWEPERARRVLLVDGEMAIESMRRRLRMTVEPGDRDALGKNLFILSADTLPAGIPDIATTKGQKLIEQHLAGVEVLILDNLSSLSKSGDENSTESWKGIQDWLVSLRSKGIAVILVHHTGKNGDQRGTSSRRDVMNIILELKRPTGHRAQDGAHVVIQWTKYRELSGENLADVEARLVSIDSKTLRWELVEKKEDRNKRILEMSESGKPQTEIAQALGMSEGNVSKILQKLRKTT